MALAEQPERPDELMYLWSWFLEARTAEGLTFTELQAWSNLTHQRPLAWEIDVLRTLDRIYWSVVND